MLTTDFESKVHKDKWCYIAISGFEATPGILNQIKRAVTIVECCRAVTLAMQEVMKNAERKRGRADFMCDVATYEQKAHCRTNEDPQHSAFSKVKLPVRL